VKLKHELVVEEEVIKTNGDELNCNERWTKLVATNGESDES